MNSKSICCSLEAAIALKEAGFCKETCFIWYFTKLGDDLDQEWHLVDSYYKHDGFVNQDRLDRILPAPTAAEIELPNSVEEGCFFCTRFIGKNKFFCVRSNNDMSMDSYMAVSHADSEVESKAKLWIALKLKEMGKI